jgi:hypothetical protein
MSVIHSTFLLFAGEYWYPNGGWADFQGQYESLEEAKQVWETSKESKGWQWCNIVEEAFYDTYTGNGPNNTYELVTELYASD